MKNKDHIPWQTSTKWGSACIVGYLYAIDQPGAGHHGVWEKQGELYKLVTHIIPGGLQEEFDRKYAANHAEPLDKILARKARQGRPHEHGGKDALARRFVDVGVWEPALDVLRPAYQKERPLKLGEILEAQELIQKAKYAGQPGVYVCVNRGNYNQIYIGHSKKDLTKRSRNHGGHAYYLVRGYPTTTVETAVELELSILNFLMDPDLCSYKPDYREGYRGCFTFLQDSFNAVEYVDRIMHIHWGQFFHQTTRYELELWLPEPKKLITP